MSNRIEILMVVMSQHSEESGGRYNPNTDVNRSIPHGLENHNGIRGGNLLQYTIGIQRVRIQKMKLLYVVIRTIRFARYVCNSER